LLRRHAAAERSSCEPVRRTPLTAAGFGEGDEPRPVFVPELEAYGAESIPERQGRNVVEGRIVVVRSLQVVVRDPGVEVVQVMQADVPGEELKHLWQSEVGAAAQRRIGVAPALGALPVDVFELVLDVEEPDTRG